MDAGREGETREGGMDGQIQFPSCRYYGKIINALEEHFYVYKASSNPKLVCFLQASMASIYNLTDKKVRLEI